MADVIVGIDLGTTNSLVAVCDDRGPRIIGCGSHGGLVPSVVRFTAGGLVECVGEEALGQASSQSARTVSGAKRAIGRPYETAAAEVRGIGSLVDDGQGRPTYAVGATRQSPERVASAILRALADRASAELSTAVQRAVITVPAYCDDAQRQATRDAARLAGVEAVRIINEPTAAALAYGIGRAGAAPETIAVFDLGGGTCDISILEVTPPVSGSGSGDLPGSADSGFFRVIATAGDTSLGGDDLDVAMARSIDPGLDGLAPGDRHDLVRACEAAKVALSGASSASLAWRGRKHEIAVEHLRELAQPLLDRALAACARAWDGADRLPIDRLLMVGGSTRAPFVREAVGHFFGVEPCTALDPDCVVALGASVQAAVLAGDRRDLLLLDVVPLSLGIETVGGAFAKLVMRNASIPTRATEMFSTSVDGQRTLLLHVVQGERELVRDCRSLARCTLSIPPMPAGIPQVEVTFTIDANGILAMSAVERRTGIRAGLQVVPTYGLSRAEVEAMEQESFTHARDDMRRHRVIDLVANASLDLGWIDAALARAGSDLDQATKSNVEAAASTLRGMVAQARRDVDAVDAEAFHGAKEALDRASVPIHEASIARTLREMSATNQGKIQ